MKQGNKVAVKGGFFCQADDGIRDLGRCRGLGEVYKKQGVPNQKLEFIRRHGPEFIRVQTQAP